MRSFGQLTNSHRPTFGKRGSFSDKGVGGRWINHYFTTIVLRTLVCALHCNTTHAYIVYFTTQHYIHWNGSVKCCSWTGVLYEIVCLTFHWIELHYNTAGQATLHCNKLHSVLTCYCWRVERAAWINHCTGSLSPGRCSPLLASWWYLSSTIRDALLEKTG